MHVCVTLTENQGQKGDQRKNRLFPYLKSRQFRTQAQESLFYFDFFTFSPNKYGKTLHPMLLLGNYSAHGIFVKLE